MRLPLRITYKDKDYVYQIINSGPITKATTELTILLDQEKLALKKDAKSIWVQTEGTNTIEPELAQALGRSVSLRYRT